MLLVAWFRHTVENNFIGPGLQASSASRQVLVPSPAARGRHLSARELHQTLRRTWCLPTSAANDVRQKIPGGRGDGRFPAAPRCSICCGSSPERMEKQDMKIQRILNHVMQSISSGCRVYTAHTDEQSKHKVLLLRHSINERK